MPELVTIKPPIKNLNDNWSPNLFDHFPFEKVYSAQRQGGEAIQRSYDEGKKFTIIEAPTGAGKSAMAMMAASFSKTTLAPTAFESKATVLSTQKALVSQYMGDFASMGLVELKGRSNYDCNTFIEAGKPVSCEDGGRMCSGDEDSDECSRCPYKEAKLRFISSPLGVTNFSYFLNETQHIGALLPRKMMVIDEAHNTESQILSLADILITKRRCEDVGVPFLDMPFIKPGQTQKAITWLNEVYMAAASAVLNKWTYEIVQLKGAKDTAAALQLGRKHSGLSRFTAMITLFLSSVSNVPNDWIVYTEDTKGSSDYGCLIIKPLSATLFAHDLLFSKAHKVVLLSATIGDFGFFMRSLGIDPNDAVTCRIDSDFPVENRPVFLKPVANMSSTKVGCPECSSEEDKGKENRSGVGCFKCYQSGQVPSIDVAMPKVASFLDTIMAHKNYSDKKGIIHTHSFKVTSFMKENLSRENKQRVISHTNEKGSRDMAISRHIDSEDPTVLMSPSMSEGLDLKDDLSRFSVIVKVPFAPLTPYVKARMTRDADWYPSLTALSIVQATGRSNRHKEDKAHHYILDSAIIKFLSRYSHLFPKWWLDSVVWPK